jgi:endonuclease YncB( thermonuclease family)
VLLLGAIAWAYNAFVKPADKERTARDSGSSSPRESRTGRASTSGGDSRRKPSTVTAVGGQRFRDRVVKVYDGDTVTLANQGSVRLVGVDCPERAQPGGPEAGEFARSLLLNQDVEVELCAKQPTDRYGRGLAFVYFNLGGRPVLFNAELVKQGYARVYSLRPCTVDEAEWNGYYEEARRQRRGLFRTLGEVPDAASYRRSKRARTTTSSLFDSIGCASCS